MSWRDRDYPDDPAKRFGRPGGDWQGVRPTIDNPMTWAVPLGRVFNILVRVHAVFLLWIVIRLGRSLVAPAEGEVALGFSHVALQMVCLFGIVLLHEFGHCFACRRVGGSADEILMWPLGGLAYCMPPNHWRAHFVTAAGGPMVNVVIYLIMVPLMGTLTQQWDRALLPLLPYEFATYLREPWWLLALDALHFMNLILLLFNLLPIFPLDGGRICQSLLWPKFGYVRSMRLAVYSGYVGAIGLGICGAVLGQWMLVAIAIFGGITCYITLKQMEWTEAVVGGEDSLYAQSLWGEEEKSASPRAAKRRAAEAKKAERKRAAEAQEQREVDRILAKIAEQGMGSVTAREKRLLKRATEGKRKAKG